MTNKLIIIGVSAVVIIAVIVVLSFIQNQNDRAEQIKVQKIAEIMDAKQQVLDVCDVTSQIVETNRKNFTEYSECVNKYYAQAGLPANQTKVQEIRVADKICKDNNVDGAGIISNLSKYNKCMSAHVSDY